MAMYVMEEMPDIHGTGEQVLYCLLYTSDAADE